MNTIEKGISDGNLWIELTRLFSSFFSTRFEWFEAVRRMLDSRPRPFALYLKIGSRQSSSCGQMRRRQMSVSSPADQLAVVFVTASQTCRLASGQVLSNRGGDRRGQNLLGFFLVLVAVADTTVARLDPFWCRVCQPLELEYYIKGYSTHPCKCTHIIRMKWTYISHDYMRIYIKFFPFPFFWRCAPMFQQLAHRSLSCQILASLDHEVTTATWHLGVATFIWEYVCFRFWFLNVS